MRKLLKALVAAILVMSFLLAGCAADNAAPKAAENPDVSAAVADVQEDDVVTVKWLGQFTALKNPRQNEILKLLNERLLSDGCYIAVDMKFETMAEYDSIIKTQYAAASFDYDLVSVFFEYGWNLSDMAGAGMIKALDGYAEIAQLAGLDVIKPQYLWDAAYVDGYCYGVPMPDFSGQNSHTTRILMRGDVMRENNIPVPTTVDELLQVTAQISAAMGGAQVRLLDYALPPYALHRTYENWPFFVDGQSLFLVDESGTVSAYPGSDVFYKDSEFFGALAEQNLLVTSGAISYEEIVGQWNMPIAFMPLSICAAFTVNKNVAEEVVISVTLNPDAPNLKTRIDDNMQVFPAASENTEAALALLQWLYGSTENRQLLQYGEEGVEYELSESGELRYLNELSQKIITSPASYGAPGDFFREEGISAALWEEYLDIGPREAYLSPAVITPFDPTPVKDAYDKVMSSLNSAGGVLDIRNGKYDISRLAEKLDELNAAGLETLVAEYQRQLDAAKK